MDADEFINRAHPMGHRHQPEPGATATGHLGEPIIATVTKQSRLMIRVLSHWWPYGAEQLSGP